MLFYFTRLTSRINIAVSTIVIAGGLIPCFSHAQQRDRQGLKEPVFKVAKTPDNKVAKTPDNKVAKTPDNAANSNDVIAANNQDNLKQHPLIPAMQIAAKGLRHIRENVKDYTATLVKRERINGELLPHEYAFVKVRNRRTDDQGNIVTPFSVYMYFHKPAKVKGNQAIYVENHNNNMLLGKAGKGMESVFGWIKLRPDGMIAMRGNRYPITELGIENLAVKLIKKGNRDIHEGDCEVTFYNQAKVAGRVCTGIEVKHPEKRPPFDFYLARVFIDDELNIPVRYAAWSWPNTPNESPQLIEEYTYTNVKINQDLTDADFDPERIARKRSLLNEKSD